MRVEFELPMKADTLNVRLRAHPMAQHRKKQKEREAVGWAMKGKRIRPVLRVTLIRRSPGELDREDNLPGSLKAFRDAVAKVLHVDDRTPLIAWEYDQEKAGDYAVRVVIEPIQPSGAV